MEDYVSQSKYVNFTDYFAESPQEIIGLLVKELETSPSFWDLNLAFDNECLDALADFISNDHERIESFYEIIRSIVVKLPVEVHHALMNMVEVITPSDKVIKSMRSDKRRRNRDIADILELGKMTSSSGVLLDEYLRGHNKSEYMDIVHGKLLTMKMQNTVMKFAIQ